MSTIIEIGSSETPVKAITLTDIYPKNYLSKINEHPYYNDQFISELSGNKVIIQRIDKNCGWKHNHSLFINTFENISYGQANQDKFVLSVLNYKKNGWFLEIGANHPIFTNNTFIMEKCLNWKGLMVEYSREYEELYKKYRTNNYLIQDALTIDYKQYFIDNNFPKNIDYLQLDLEAENASTITVLEILEKTVFPEYTFSVVTFEHDIYRGDFFDTRRRSREIFERNGYLMVFGDVMHLDRIFEDWYVHPNYVNMDYINKIKTSTSLNQDEIFDVLQSVSH